MCQLTNGGNKVTFMEVEADKEKLYDQNVIRNAKPSTLTEITREEEENVFRARTIDDIYFSHYAHMRRYNKRRNALAF